MHILQYIKIRLKYNGKINFKLEGKYTVCMPLTYHETLFQHFLYVLLQSLGLVRLFFLYF